MPRRVIALFTLLAFVSQGLGALSYPIPPIPEGMRRVDGPYHVLIHDLTDAEAAEVLARMEAMVREYTRRTSGFSGQIQGKMPFLLFRRDADYINAGGMEGSAGMFDGQSLKAVAGKRLTNNTWHTIQHEGFHQFAHLVIGGELPPWVNEGMAEYFGEGVYCGDGFVTGGIPVFRLERIQQSLHDKQFKPLSEFMRMTHEEWNGGLTEQNYDQAWSMVQFLAHADGGKYQQAFTQFMTDLSHGHAWQPAWEKAFGRGDGFETAWQTWWLERPKNPTVDVYATAAVRMLAGYAARAASQKQPIPSAEELLATIKRDAIKAAPADALPPGLAADCVELAASLGKVGVTFSIEFPKKGATQWPLAVVATLPDGRIVRGTTPTRGPRAGDVNVTTQTPKKPTTRKA